MNRVQYILVVLCILLIAGSAVVLASQDTDDTLCFPTGFITLEPPDSVEPKRSPVEFPHSVHFDFSCKTCHHTWDGGGELYSCSTSECHDLAKAPQKTGQGKADEDLAVRYYKKAFHDLCIGCHKDIKKKNREMAVSGKMLQDKLMKAGPTGCVKCHPKD